MLDVAALGPAPEARARALFGAGADWIQLRDRSVESGRLLETARALVRARDAIRRETPGATLRSPPRVIVNRRGDVARAASADGLHLGFDALDAPDARAILDGDRPPTRETHAQRPSLDALGPPLLGRSLHSASEVASASGVPGIDYVHLAPIWDPVSKPATRPALGVATLAAACRHGLPVFAQGGLDPARAAEAIRAGAVGIALTGALARPDAPAEALQSIREALDEVSPTT